MTTTGLKSIYTTSQGEIKIPFGFAFSVFTVPGIRLQPNEIRALANMDQFISSLSIMSHRLREYLSQFKSESWAYVQFDGLFLDTQAFFLFVQQFLEDVSLVTRISLPSSIRGQMSPTFYKGFIKVVPPLLTDDHPLKIFLTQENDFFLELKDLRDDILHRTGFGRTRLTQFPNFMNLILAAGGKDPFASGEDLRGYISTCMKKIMAFACLCGDYVKGNFQQIYPEKLIGTGPAFIRGLHMINFQTDDLSKTIEPGTVIMNIDLTLLDSLMFFLQ